MSDTDPIFVAFSAEHRLARGDAQTVAAAARQARAEGGERVLTFELSTGRVVDLDPTGEIASPAPERRGPGRPKLGVTAREVTLLPRHWDWLSRQPGGASVALRKLVEAARKSADGEDERRSAQSAAYAFMTAMAGDLPGFEEALRALFASDRPRFQAQTASWPAHVRETACEIAAPSFQEARHHG